MALLVFSWLIVWFQENKWGFITNSFKVLVGIYSWVGYGKNIRKDLPSIRPSVLSPVDLLPNSVSEERTNKALLNYSKNYDINNDFLILRKQWRRLGS